MLVFTSFTVSASAGLGGSLVLVPTLAIYLGPKEGVALAALLLAGNNMVKIFAYRQTLPFRAAALVTLLTVMGAAVGSALLVRAPIIAVTVAVVIMFGATLIVERVGLPRLRAGFGPFLALVSGASSGFSGTSGPLKGVAIRNLDLDRRHFVGAASLASFAGDATKVAIFTEGQVLGSNGWLLAGGALPLMALGTWVGSTCNDRVGEHRFALLFWTVMSGYTLRLGLLLF